jgi:CheY-specific phosphatase CheX
MTPALNRPDLRQLGQRAFTEALSVFLSLPATPGTPSRPSPPSRARDQITSKVRLAGQRLSGSVHLHLPREFVARAVHRLTGLEDAERDAVLEDAAGELANLVAGRVAAQLAADGYACLLDTPSVSRSPDSASSPDPGGEHGRTDLFCDGHWLALEVQCHYAVL